MKNNNRNRDNLQSVSLNNYPANCRFAEAYRTLRSNVHFAFMDKAFKLLVVTSAGEEEGKTSTVMNLGYTLAQSGKSVLLLDADLRKPNLSRLVENSRVPGLTGILSDAFGVSIHEGDLGRFSVSDLIHLAAFQRKTGSLLLDDGKERVELIFELGELVDLNWETRPPAKKLAQTLVADGRISKEQVEAAMRRQKDTGQKLGFILIGMGLLKAEDLDGVLAIHMMEALRIALQMREGRFRFNELAESRMEGNAFRPVDLERLYRQLIVGEETLNYIQDSILSAVEETDISSLSLLRTGPVPPNPSELLESERMAFLLTFLKKRFDVIIVDTPPVLPASDALLLAPKSDGVVLVVKAGHLKREMVRNVVDQLHRANARTVGVVLNQVDMKKEGYYKYYYKYYTKYYGKEA